jgi:energy-coupling factor transporter transmembrane protein EcfT
MELGTLVIDVPADSVVHRLDPRTKILATGLLAVAVFALHEAAGLEVLTVFLAAVIAAGRIPLATSSGGSSRSFGFWASPWLCRSCSERAEATRWLTATHF